MNRKRDASVRAWLRIPLLVSLFSPVADAASTGGARADHARFRAALDIADTEPGVLQVWNTVNTLGPGSHGFRMMPSRCNSW